MTMTKALTVSETGGSEVLKVLEREVPEPAEGELLVQVAAAGVNFIDIYVREGIYPTPLPYVVGREGAGVVQQVGPGVSGFAAGDRVAWAPGLGSATGLALVPARSAAIVPDAVELDLAAAALLQGMTAHCLVNSCYDVRPGDWTLVHAAAGGVGQLLIQLIKARGGHVIGTVSTPEKAAKATALGADRVVGYADVAAAVHEATGGEGVPVVYDGVGKSTFDSSLDALRVRGTLVVFGAASGPVPPFDVQRLNRGGSLFLTRPTLDHYLRTPEELAERSSAVFNAVADGSLKIEIGGRYPLADAARAYDDLQGRRTSGKLLLIP